jgi:hypothetical protein
MEDRSGTPLPSGIGQVIAAEERRSGVPKGFNPRDEGRGVRFVGLPPDVGLRRGICRLREEVDVGLVTEPTVPAATDRFESAGSRSIVKASDNKEIFSPSWMWLPLTWRRSAGTSQDLRFSAAIGPVPETGGDRVGDEEVRG